MTRKHVHFSLTCSSTRELKVCFDWLGSRVCCLSSQQHFVYLIHNTATEPELLIPLSCVLDPNVGSHPQCEIAICGDPRQLSPQIYSNILDSLGRSFLERLLRRPVTALGGGEASLLGPMKSSDLIIEGASSLGEWLQISCAKTRLVLNHVSNSFIFTRIRRFPVAR